MVPAGTLLVRVYSTAYPAVAFHPGPAHRYYGGGRFDGTADDPYGYLYAGDSYAVAIAEALLRDVEAGPAGALQIPRGRVAGRSATALRTTADVTVVDLVSAQDLAAVSQDTWVTQADGRDYAQTRHWAHWIRGHAPGAAGFRWVSRREPTGRAYVLFSDRCPPGLLQAAMDPSVPSGDKADFDHPQGRRELRRALSAYGAVVARR